MNKSISFKDTKCREGKIVLNVQVLKNKFINFICHLFFTKKGNFRQTFYERKNIFVYITIGNAWLRLWVFSLYTYMCFLNLNLKIGNIYVRLMLLCMNMNYFSYNIALNCLMYSPFVYLLRNGLMVKWYKNSFWIWSCWFCLHGVIFQMLILKSCAHVFLFSTFEYNLTKMV